MSDPLRDALEEHLTALDAAFPTAWENKTFKPVIDTPYQRAFLLRAEPQTPTLKQRLTLLRGVFQVSLCYPAGTGTDEPEARAKLLKDHFPPLLVLTNGGVSLKIEGEAKIGGAINEPGWYVVPVDIRFVSIT